MRTVLTMEFGSRGIQLSVVFQAVNADFETRPLQFSSETFGHPVFALLHEVERRAETELRLQLGEEFEAGEPPDAFSSWVSTTAKCLPSGHPGQPEGTTLASRWIGHVFVWLDLATLVRRRRNVVRNGYGKYGLTES